jgi:hypothetical protein
VDPFIAKESPQAASTGGDRLNQNPQEFFTTSYRRGLRRVVHVRRPYRRAAYHKGVARYASDGGFTVPTAAYPRS